MKKKLKKDNLTLKLVIICTFILILILLLFNKTIDIKNINFNLLEFLIKYRLLSIYLMFINFITFIIFGLDKFKSINKKWRIKESTLINLCVIGGSIGGLISMYLFHHKTKHSSFYIGIPLIIITQIIIFIYVINII